MSRPAGNSQTLDPAQLQLLTAIQDRLIPREGDMPGAGEIGGAEVVAGYLRERPALHRDITAALDAVEATSGGPAPFGNLADDDKDAVLRQVEADLPDEFETLWRQTYNSYYTNTAIQERLGAGALPPQPHGYVMPAFDETRLDAVKKRDKLWRDA
ncbi:MAG: gluconate 2-dehydrogenase subunit 3 family protein [Chloroflexi bacterium]|nr:gluconate 2-dehydrogenase subunit 3 family protein [Chloroflexota bacterium]MCY3936802.1 gluconate 2-dehydrogenase subunit 3 family protein [Chloroflexota bacterium]